MRKNNTLLTALMIDMKVDTKASVLVDLIKRNGESHRAAHIALKSEFEKRHALICETHDEADKKLFADLGALLGISQEDVDTRMSLDLDYVETNKVAFVRVDEQPTAQEVASLLGNMADSLRSAGFEVHTEEANDDDDDTVAEHVAAPAKAN